ncbi:MAG: PfkB family carbohydrate kinase [Myxococcales bacterium]|nr:PfkB family carbohydrate kinase [Myxococcales bacterium]
MSLLVVGSVALDSVETPFGKRDSVLGGSATYFSAAASLLTKVSVVGVVGDDFPSGDLDFLQKRGVDLEGLEKVPGRTFRWKGKYGFDLNAAQTLDTQLNVFEHFSPRLGPKARKAERIFLGNIDPELQLRVLEQAENPRLVCADTMNFWISGKRASLLKLLPRVDVLMVNDGEVRQLAGEANVIKAAHAAQRLGAKIVVVKRGEYGALLVDQEQSFYSPAFPIADVIDPTGAGDSFAGGFLGLLDRLDSKDPAALRQATVMGSTIASFTVEQFSLDRLRGLDLAQVRRRFDAFRALVHFEELPEHVA